MSFPISYRRALTYPIDGVTSGINMASDVSRHLYGGPLVCGEAAMPIEVVGGLDGQICK